MKWLYLNICFLLLSLSHSFLHSGAHFLKPGLDLSRDYNLLSFVLEQEGIWGKFPVVTFPRDVPSVHLETMHLETVHLETMHPITEPSLLVIINLPELLIAM